MAVFEPDARETNLCIEDREIIEKTIIVPYNFRIFMKHFFENKILKIFISPNFYKLFQTRIFFVRSNKFWSKTAVSHVHTNLGGTSHRVSMTLESRISRFRKQ